ncbi:hypothetical protein [Sulfurimonas sp.]|uniref:hypothetical protein n=1 Tax=Sulfurimonas sp. TaxID=2022749 RepID=UPI0025F11DAE|nr:hypothetical protein [Sulfurimonas sp.]
MAKKINEENRTELRKKFDEVTYYGFKEYARRNNITESRLARALGNKVKAFTYETMEVYKQLKTDGIYEDEFFPWEKEFKDREESKKSA